MNHMYYCIIYALYPYQPGVVTESEIGSDYFTVNLTSCFVDARNLCADYRVCVLQLVRS